MRSKTVAYTAPFLIFMLFLGVAQGLDAAHLTPPGVPAIYVIFPLQTAVCAGLLAYFWRQYPLRIPSGAWIAAAAGLLVFAIWVSPQVLLRMPARLGGFDPQLFAARPALFWAEITIRLARAIIVVPLLEEIFWRGFLLRYFMAEDFESIPFGAWSWKANALVALGFMLEHSTQDYPAALAAGLLFNCVAYRTKSLSSCVLAHALANALLDAYILATHQWGFW